MLQYCDRIEVIIDKKLSEVEQSEGIKPPKKYEEPKSEEPSSEEHAQIPSLKD